MPTGTYFTVRMHRVIGSGMRMRRKVVVTMHFDTMVLLARFFLRIKMNYDER